MDQVEDRETDRVGQLFPDLNADNDDEGLTEIESLCLSCYQQGMTRLLLTKIPFFREVILSSFHCNSCGYSDCGIQSGSRVEEKGVCYTLTVQTAKDLNRQVIKSDFASVFLPALEFEQAPSRRGEVTTVEGILSTIASNLQQMQSEKCEHIDADNSAKIDEFIRKLLKLKELDESFQIIVDDPSGNSFVENPIAPLKDDALTVQHYIRTRQQDIDIGCLSEDAENGENASDEVNKTEVKSDSENIPFKPTDEVLSFPANCGHCNAPCETNMKLIDIPFFKQVVIMATVCDTCGKRDNEVKSGSGIEAKGTKTTLHLTDASDLSRDILKSDTCAVEIPELELELQEGTLGGRFTTIEGLLLQIKEQLEDKNPFIVGDSSNDETRERMREFCDKLDQVITGKRLDVHLILDDPAGNSYVQNVYAPESDPELKIEHYERSFEQNETLGLNDMKTENYSSSDS